MQPENTVYTPLNFMLLTVDSRVVLPLQRRESVRGRDVAPGGKLSVETV